MKVRIARPTLDIKRLNHRLHGVFFGLLTIAVPGHR